MKSHNHQPFTISLFIAALLIFVGVTHAQTTPDKIDQLISKYAEYGKFNGSVLVANKGEVVFKKGYGDANMEWNIPNAPNTKHRLGSITKQFTAMLILQLVQDGELTLHDPITAVLPNYPKANGDKITIHHLLTHTSGIPNYTAMPDFFQDKSRDPYTPEEFVATFSELELEFEPGKQFNYSNSGYFLLGYIMEEVTGKSYAQLLQERIFDPIGMKDTGFDLHEEIIERRATGYEKRGNEYVNSSYLDMSIPYAAGSMYATVEDLYKWDRALYTNQLLNTKYMKKFFTPEPINGKPNTYAYGFDVADIQIGNTSDSILCISHGGGINGFNTIIARCTTDQSLVVLLNNTGGAPLMNMTIAIQGILKGKTYDLPRQSISDAMAAVIYKDGIDAGLDFFSANAESDHYDVLEEELNSLGYNLMRQDRLEDATKLFKMIIDRYPSSFNAYDSYGEALMNQGQIKLAIKNYTKSIELNPGNQNGIDMLQKMGVNTDDLVKDVEVPTMVLDTYLGEYELAPGFSITVTREGSQLKAQATNQPQFDLFAKSNNEFYLKVVPAQIVFNRNENGMVESMTLFQNGREMQGKKIK